MLTLFSAPGCCGLIPAWTPPPTGWPPCCCCKFSVNRLPLLPIPAFPRKPILGEPFRTWAPISPWCCCPVLPFWAPIKAAARLSACTPPTIPTCCVNPDCCCWPWGCMPWGPLEETFMFPIIAMEGPDGALLEVGPPGWAGAPARKSSDSCLCFAAASWPLPPIPTPSPPRVVWSWLASPPFVNPKSEELMSSSGRSCSRSKREPKSTQEKQKHFNKRQHLASI